MSVGMLVFLFIISPFCLALGIFLLELACQLIIDKCWHSYEEIPLEIACKRGNYIHDFRCIKCGKEKTEYNEMSF